MSINDLFESEVVIPIVIVICIVFFITIPLFIANNEKKIYGESEEDDTIINSAAIIVDRRTTRNYLTRNIEMTLIVFEFEDGSRIELAVQDASTMVVGDSGMLKYQGKKFIQFEREKHNAKQD